MHISKLIIPALLLFILISCKESSTGPENPEPECNISASTSSIELGLEESETVSASTEGSCSGSISWQSSDSDIVSLDSNSGTSVKATGVSEGQANITASIKDQDGNTKDVEIEANIIFKPVVVYQKQTKNGSQSSDVWIADKFGNQRQVTDESKNWDGIYSPVQWIDDGEKIAYLTHEKGVVYSVNIDGENKKSLTGNNVEIKNFEISHDGSKIAFEGRDQSGQYGIHAQNLNSKETTLVDDYSEAEAPKWSPDDKYIASTVYNIAITNENREKTGSDIHIKKSDGSGESQNLTKRQNTFDALPSWSPNGEKIAFIFQGESSASTHVMNVDGSNENLVKDEFYCTSWISSDQLICMAKINGDDYDLYKVSLDGSHEILMDTPENEIYPNWKN